MIKIKAEFAKLYITIQWFADQVRVILKKGCFSELEILQICGLVSCEEYS